MTLELTSEHKQGFSDLASSLGLLHAELVRLQENERMAAEMRASVAERAKELHGLVSAHGNAVNAALVAGEASTQDKSKANDLHAALAFVALRTGQLAKVGLSEHGLKDADLTVLERKVVEVLAACEGTEGA